MKYNFDEIIHRENTGCYKYDLREKFFKDSSVTPMWVADMDFRTPDFVMNSIRERCNHEILGYSYRTEAIYQSVIDWLSRRHQWQIKKEHLGFTPGVVPALNFAILALSNPGDKIIIQTPVYFPFYSAVKDHNRVLIENELVLENGRYRMDIQKLKNQVDDKTRLLILCSPHNPTGNVWKEGELKELTDFCLEKNITIISDEIHADVVYPGHKHIPTAKLSEEVANITLTLMAPSKTFNFAGLATSYIIASNSKLFKQVNDYAEKLHLTMGNIFGSVALEAAYTYGDEWLDSLISYLSSNVALAKDFINSEMPDIDLINPEATFLIWMDFRKLGIPRKELSQILIEKARLGLSEGWLFGTNGAGFERMNIGCPSQIVEKALVQLKKAFFS